MKTLLFPGLGKVTPDLFSEKKDFKSHYMKLVEAYLQKYKISDNSLHELTSSFSVAEGIAISEFYKKNNGTYSAVCGYSVGQIAALFAANILDAESAIKLSIERSLLMKKYMPANYGMMSIIGPDQETIKDILIANGLEKKIFFSTINSQFNHSLCGHISEISKLITITTSRNFQTKILDVEGAWHSPFLKDCVEEYSLILDKYNFTTPTCFYICNFSGKFEKDPLTIKNNLLGHMCSPVLWNECIKTLVSLGTTHFMECGQGDQLKKMLFYMRSKPCYPMANIEDVLKCVEL